MTEKLLPVLSLKMWCSPSVCPTSWRTVAWTIARPPRWSLPGLNQSGVQPEPKPALMTTSVSVKGPHPVATNSRHSLKFPKLSSGYITARPKRPGSILKPYCA